MVAITQHLTVEALERDGMPDGRWELIDGVLVEVAAAGARHGRISGTLIGHLFLYARSQKLGIVYNADTGFVLPGEPPAIRMPDVGFVRKDRLPANHDDGGFFRGAPDLAIEVISPNDRMADVLAKVAVWLEAGTVLVWLVDPIAKTVTVFHADRGPHTYGATQLLTGEDILPGFSLPVRDIFEI